ncbi:MAG: hypothetical protein U9R14_00580 [Patescibacteria group bacterium]|nr:hypothetical protein [Patescibacteria group bacterium]
MQALKKNHKRMISLQQAKKLIIGLVFVLLFDFLLFPLPAMAGFVVEEADISAEQAMLTDLEELELNNSDIILNTKDPIIINHLPENNTWSVKKTGYYTITAYNSEVAQCDASPCITANGFNLCEHGIEDSIAVNFLPFGAKIRIPELFSDKVFIVRDRMNARYFNRLDIWMVEKEDAKKFGVRLAKIEVLKQ